MCRDYALLILEQSRQLASHISRPTTPTTPALTPRALSPGRAALHLNMPKEDSNSPSPDLKAPAFSTRRQKRARAATTATGSSAPATKEGHSDHTQPSNTSAPKRKGRPSKKARLGPAPGSL